MDWSFQGPFAQAIKLPLLLSMANAFLVQLTGVGQGLSIFHLLVVGAIFWAGWRVNREMWGNLKLAALAGPLVFAAGLVLMGGTLQVLFGDFSAASAAAAGSWAEHWPRLAYLLGLLVASVLVAPVTVLISVAGGICAEYL